MNKWLGMGRLVADPEVSYSQGENAICIARYRLAIDRRYKREGDEQTADFINCVTFGKNAEFVDKYLHKGMKIAVEGRIQTGSYTNKEGQKVYTTDIVVEAHDFCESRNNSAPANDSNNDEFATIPPDIEAELPF